MVSIGLTVAVLALTVRFVHGAHLLERDFRQEVVLQRSIGRLAPQLRNDIRRATQAKTLANTAIQLRFGCGKPSNTASHRMV